MNSKMLVCARQLSVLTWLVAATSCSQGEVRATGQAVGRRPGELVKSAGDTVRDVLPIADVLQRQTTSLMTIHGVVGTGEGRDGDKPVIVVYVSPQITREDRVRIPLELEGYKVEIREAGNVTAPPGKR
jgi:hypothetical protein